MDVYESCGRRATETSIVVCPNCDPSFVEVESRHEHLHNHRHRLSGPLNTQANVFTGRLRVHCFGVSLDGFGAGADQTR